MKIKMKKKIAVFLTGCLALNFCGCKGKLASASLMDGITAKPVTEQPVDERFINALSDFAVSLFQKMISEEGNTLVSPLSVSLALAMTANGAEGQTKQEMEQVLGNGITIEELNAYLFSFVKQLPSEEKAKLLMANAIWIRDLDGSISVRPEFLQTNADYYGADAYSAKFDDSTKKDINQWVDDKTDGMIPKIIDKIDSDTVMYLVNALTFDAEWQRIYKSKEIHSGTFTSLSGKEQKVDFMASFERTYLEDESVSGFLKPYAGGNYSFVGLLPKEGLSVTDYVASLTGEEFRKLLENKSTDGVQVQLPKFTYETSTELEEILSELGMPTAFDGAADFSKMGSTGGAPLFIGSVLHKTYIQVDGKGTRAGAVTKVEMTKEAAPLAEKQVILDRPFVYAIIENETGLPLFLGAVTSIK